MKKKKQNDLTLFLAGLAKKAERSGSGIYAAIVANEDVQKLLALDEDAEKALKRAVTLFVGRSFNEMLTSIIGELTLLLLEIKNQRDEHELSAKPADIVKLEEMGASAAAKLRILADVTRRAATMVDWEYVAEAVIKAGSESTETPKQSEDGDSNPFSNN